MVDGVVVEPAQPGEVAQHGLAPMSIEHDVVDLFDVAMTAGDPAHDIAKDDCLSLRR